jgi:hypothetical protein
MSAVKQADAETLRKNEAKWSKPLMAAGWNALPNIIIEKQEALGLDALDMNIILHLSHYWWTAENLPFPSVATIAKAIGVTPRTVQKRISALHELMSTAAEKCARWRRKSVPVGLIKKGLEALLIDARCEPRGA